MTQVFTLLVFPRIPPSLRYSARDANALTEARTT